MEAIKGDERFAVVVAQPMITMSAGVVVVDEYRITTPRAMTTAEGYDVPLGQGINMSAPRSVATGTGGQDETKKKQDHVNDTASRVLSRTFAIQADEYRDKTGRRTVRGTVETKEGLLEKGDSSAGEAQMTDDEGGEGLVEFEPWVNRDGGLAKKRRRRSCRKWVQLFFSSMVWDVLYIANFTLWTLLKAAADLVPQDKVAMVRSYIDRPLLGMSLLALVPFVSAVCYRLLDPVLINTAPRKERRAWSIIFVLGLRSAAHSLTVSVAAIKGLFARSEPSVSTEPQAPLVRYYSKSKQDGVTHIRWRCRVCGHDNPSQVFRFKKSYRPHAKTIPFRQRQRTVCVANEIRETNSCALCQTPWSYHPRQCANHCFYPSFDGPPRKRRPRPSKSGGLQGLGRRLLSCLRGLRAWALAEVHLVTADEMIDKIQDDDKLYFRDYKFRDLHKDFLMPSAERQEVRFERLEEVECDFRQPFFLPAAIVRVHENDTYDVRFANGELVKNALKWTIRGRPVVHQWPWAQVFSMTVFFGLIFLPAAAGGVASDVMKNSAVVFWLMSSAMLAAMVHHLWAIFRRHAPLRPRFKNKIVRLWLTPFLVLWLFATASLAKADGRLVRVPWSLLLVLSYLFSVLLTFWLALAKPVYGLACAVLTVPWTLAQFAIGLRLDGRAEHVPLVALLLPTWVFVACVLAWHQAMPFLWDGSLPHLSVIHWPCLPSCLHSRHPEPEEDDEDDDGPSSSSNGKPPSEQPAGEKDHVALQMDEGMAPQDEAGGEGEEQVVVPREGEQWEVREEEGQGPAEVEAAMEEGEGMGEAAWAGGGEGEVGQEGEEAAAPDSAMQEWGQEGWQEGGGEEGGQAQEGAVWDGQEPTAQEAEAGEWPDEGAAGQEDEEGGQQQQEAEAMPHQRARSASRANYLI